MFDNIGSKLKGLAIVVCLLGIIASVIYAIVFWNSGVPGAFLTGLIILVCGCLISWIGSWACYGIGTAAEGAQKAYELEAQVKELNKALNTLQAALNNQNAIAQTGVPGTTKDKSRNQNTSGKTAGESIPAPIDDRKWTEDGPLYLICPQCKASISRKSLDSNKQCRRCGCAYNPDDIKNEG